MIKSKSFEITEMLSELIKTNVCWFYFHFYVLRKYEYKCISVRKCVCVCVCVCVWREKLASVWEEYAKEFKAIICICLHLYIIQSVKVLSWPGLFLSSAVLKKKIMLENGKESQEKFPRRSSKETQNFWTTCANQKLIRVQGCRIHQLVLCKGVRPLNNKCPSYDTKQCNGEAPVHRQMQITHLLPSLQCPLWPGVVVPDRVLFTGQIQLFDIWTACK